MFKNTLCCLRVTCNCVRTLYVHVSNLPASFSKFNIDILYSVTCRRCTICSASFFKGSWAFCRSEHEWKMTTQCYSVHVHVSLYDQKNF